MTQGSTNRGFERATRLAAALEATRGEDAGEVDAPASDRACTDPERFGVALATVDGGLFSAGDATAQFTIQSISKALVYAMAIDECG